MTSRRQFITLLGRWQIAEGYNSVAATGSSRAALAAKAATSTIPIVFSISEDPIGLGLVASVARPGGNATGVNFLTTELTAKRLQLLRELVPAATRVAVLVNPNNPNAEATLREVAAAGRAIGIEIAAFKASTSREIDAAFASFDRPHALFVGGDGFFVSRRMQLTSLANRHALPAIFSPRDFAEAGGLITYGSDISRQLSPSGSVQWPHSQRRQAGRLTGGAIGQVRTGHQPPDCQDAGHHRAGNVACQRRRGD
jgi:putative tryptophan/tyrosine transport system substrate-binding protein